jgi:glycosyltransferase involved in cell wall biosynthesis
VAISNGVSIAPLTDAPRAFDFGFWGRLAYFANADAAAWLLDEIWPSVRARMPHATLLIGGADAPARIRAAHGRDGIEVRSPVDDIAAFARQIRVALFPLRYGTGQSNKVLEAAEGGCAVVATAKAMRGLDPLTRHSFIGNDAPELARLAIAAISDESRRASTARALRDVVEASYARQETLDRLAAIVHAREAAA